METLNPKQCTGNNLLVPTRWGNQLNGNNQPRPSPQHAFLIVPTRWGNQLNGNVGTHSRIVPAVGTNSVPTRWGNQLNGNCE